MIPTVWVGGSCGVVTDAAPGTYPGRESECDYCEGGCSRVSVAATEYEVDGPEEEINDE